MNKNNIDIKAVIIFIFVATVIGMSSCINNTKLDRQQTLTHYTMTGEVIEEWNNVVELSNGPGWCKIRTAEGEIITISGTFKLTAR